MTELPLHLLTPESTLVSAMRSRPLIAPGDSAFRVAELLRDTGADTLPVVDARGRLIGVVGAAELRPLLSTSSAAMAAPIGSLMRRASAVARPDASLDQVRQSLTDSGETTIFVVDEGDQYLGAISLPDLLAPSSTPPRPRTVGGMATPWGVYLTDGTLQAGVGNLALLGSGALMGLMLAVSGTAVAAASWLAQHFVRWPLYSMWTADLPARITLSSAWWYPLHALPMALFLIAMRMMPLAGYHAAEHQSVHAMERGEPLHTDIVRRMPRVHPRCGTNLMAAALVFTGVAALLPALQVGLGAPDSAMIAALLALFTWRSVGGFLQQYFTTRPATDCQLASGIAAAMDLEHKYLHSVLRRPTLPRRLWCVGLAQVAIGASLAGFAAYWLFGILMPQIK